MTFQFTSIFWKILQYSRTYDTPIIWNDLPDEVRKLTCLFQVKVEVIPLWKSISTLIFQFPLAFSVVLTLQYLWFMIIEQCFLCDVP